MVKPIITTMLVILALCLVDYYLTGGELTSEFTGRISNAI